MPPLVASVSDARFGQYFKGAHISCELPMPIETYYHSGTGIFSGRAWGPVSEDEIESAKHTLAHYFDTAFPRALYFDMGGVTDYPAVFPRAVRYLHWINGHAKATRRALPLVLFAPYGSLGYSIARVYHAQSVASTFVPVELIEDETAVCLRLRDLLGVCCDCAVRCFSVGVSTADDICHC